MRRPERADSSTARVAIEGALGAAEKTERAERTMMGAATGYLLLFDRLAGRWLEMLQRT